ncbi:MAG: GAF domain-containing protein [Breznakibacter sp.]
MKLIEKKYPKIFLRVIGGILSIILVLKLIAASSVWSMPLVILEITSWIFILIIFYILYRFYSDSQKENFDLKEQQTQQKKNFEEIDNKLNDRINELEIMVNTRQKFLHHKEESLHAIFSSISTQNLQCFLDSLLPALSKQLEAVLGIAYWFDEASQRFIVKTTYAIDTEQSIEPFALGDGFCGQSALDQRIIVLDNVPADYMHASSGLGSCLPSIIYYLPIEINGSTTGLIEIGGFKRMDIEKIWPEVNQKIKEICKIF